MVDEYDSIMRNSVWDVVPRLGDKLRGLTMMRPLLLLQGDDQLIKSCKEDLAREFEMKDMGLMHYLLAWRCGREMGNWRKEDATSGEVVAATVYRQLVGSLMYLVNTRPDLCFAVNQLSQAMVQPTKLFWKAAKHVLRYLRGTTQYGLWYRRIKGVKLQGFTDADWAGSPSDKKSTSGGIFNLGSAAVSWYRKKQRSVALSTAEAEYMAAS
eukprot:PITA_25794